MAPEAIRLLLTAPGSAGTYLFSCPACRDTVEKPADRRIVALLLSAGVGLADDAATHDSGPGPGHHPVAARSGPPFTVDDVLAFRALLQDDERLYRSLPRP